jgi:hypothetical protein
MATLQQTLTNQTRQNIEAGEARIRELRNEPLKRLEAVSPEHEEPLLTLCALVFRILSAQDDLNRERNGLMVLGNTR